MQKVELYYDMLEAKVKMEEYIENGWRVHTCTMGAYMAGNRPTQRVIIVYERE